MPLSSIKLILKKAIPMRPQMRNIYAVAATALIWLGSHDEIREFVWENISGMKNSISRCGIGPGALSDSREAFSETTSEKASLLDPRGLRR
jgi:hypothetical protein